MGQGSDDNNKTFQPHADVDQQRDDKQSSHIGSNLFDKERQRHNAIAGNHQPEIGVHLSEGAKPEERSLILRATVIGDKKFDGVSVGHNQTGKDDHLGNAFQVLNLDNLLKTGKGPAQWYHYRQNHRATGKDGPGHEIGRKDG